jgi:hypothetical protein
MARRETGFTGYDWQVVAIGHSGMVTPIPTRLGVALQFSSAGQTPGCSRNQAALPIFPRTGCTGPISYVRMTA